MSDGSWGKRGWAGDPYPPAPWQLRGWGFATLQGIDTRAARRFVPPDCRIVPVAPGRTLGGLVFVSYELGSTLVYRELSVVAALVRVGLRCAFYLPRLYVDSAASLAGGRGIWGVAKQMASFDVSTSGGARTIVVRSGADAVCRLQVEASRAGMRLTVPVPAVGMRPESFLFFSGRLTARFGLLRAAVELPPDSEFAELSLDRPRFTIALDDFDLRVPIPVALSRRAAPAFVAAS